MITASKLQSAYNDLYLCMCKYIWDFPTVDALADLEIETYQTFPDMECLKKKLYCLKRFVSHIDALEHDSELSQRFDDFESLIADNADLYASLKIYKEVIV